MAKRTVEESSLTAVADAIRRKAGVAGDLIFPADFVNAVEGIWDYSCLMDGSVTDLVIPNSVTKLRTAAFQDCKNLRRIELHDNVSEIGSSCFFSCEVLREVILPPKVKELRAHTFFLCWSLNKVDCWITDIPESDTFGYCERLYALIIRSDTVCTLSNINAFNSGSSMVMGTGFIYVPRALVDDYKAATNWSTFASQIRAIEDYPDITGG